MTELTDKQLEGLGAQAFNLAKRDLEQREFNFLLATYHDGQGLHRMTMVEALITEKLGQQWLNNGRAKEIGFGIIRGAVDLVAGRKDLTPDAIVFASIVNNFKPTPKMDCLTSDRRRAIVTGGHDKHHQAVRDGYMSVCDALCAIVQTPTRVCMYRQDFDERNNAIGKPNSFCSPQADFGGKMKFFGKDELDGKE